MLKIDTISTDPYQKLAIFLPGGDVFTMVLYFRPMQTGWFINELTYQDFTLKGLRITVQPNMLRPFLNKLPFGLACFSKGNREPTQQNDFVSGDISLYVLPQDEVEAFEAFLRGQV